MIICGFSIDFFFEVIIMVEKDLQKLSRADLLQMLIDQSEELNQLREKYAAVQAALAQKEVIVSEAGSLADAVFKLNGIFDVAQVTAQQYLDNLKSLAHRQEVLCVERENECMERAGRLLVETEKRCAKMEEEARARSEELISKAKEESQKHWDEVSSKIDAYYDSHVGLRELLTLIAPDFKKSEN